MPDDENCFDTVGYPDSPGAMADIDGQYVTER
jgi:hypothetical protein